MKRPQNVPESAWRNIDDQAKTVWDELPKHVQDLLIHQAGSNPFFRGEWHMWLVPIILFIMLIGLWQAGYPPWFFLQR